MCSFFVKIIHFAQRKLISDKEMTVFFFILNLFRVLLNTWVKREN